MAALTPYPTPPLEGEGNGSCGLLRPPTGCGDALRGPHTEHATRRVPRRRTLRGTRYETQRKPKKAIGTPCGICTTATPPCDHGSVEAFVEIRDSHKAYHPSTVSRGRSLPSSEGGNIVTPVLVGQDIMFLFLGRQRAKKSGGRGPCSSSEIFLFY